MSEYGIVWLSGLSGLGLVISSTLYSLGGRSKKWLRRWLGSFILATVVNFTFHMMGRWSPWYLGIFALLALSYHLGYGASNTIEKVVRRTLYALAVLMSGLLCAIVLIASGNVSIMNVCTLFVIHTMLCGISVIIGVRNPVYAANEEFFVSMVLNLCLILYPFVGT